MKHIVIGTAGHIDHGKTSLVKALTGVDTDRLKEEKERGITIELGFASLDLDGVHAGLVDVPGHERFVKNMLAGAVGIDLVMLVVAADEGVMPQTREHLSICRLLGVRSGLIALTKADLVEPDWLELVRDDLADFVSGTFLEGRPIIPVSAHTGEGINELLAQLKTLASELAPRSEAGIFRLPIDRVFTMRGFGVVVTGTLFSGKIEVGDRIQVYPGQHDARVRGLQVHGQSVEEAGAGLRTAINLQGLEKAEIERGDVLARPDELKPTYMLDVHLEHLADAPRPLKPRDRLRFHAGTAEVMGRIYPIGRDTIEPGESAYAQLRLENPVALLPRDRFVVRSYSPIITIGGGEVLDVRPPKHRRHRAASIERFQTLHAASDAERLRVFLKEAGTTGADIRELTGRLTFTPAEIRAELDRLHKAGEVHIIDTESGLSLTARHFEAVQESIRKFLAAYHKANPLRPGASREEVRGKAGGTTERVFSTVLAAMTRAGLAKEEGALVRLASHEVLVGEELERVKDKIEGVFKQARFQPPFLNEALEAAGEKEKASREALQLLINQGQLVRLKENILYHREALAEARKQLEEYLQAHREISAAEFRDLLGITRKHAIPLLEFFDTARVTLRIGDKRVLRPQK